MNRNSDPGLRHDVGELAERLGNDPHVLTDSELIAYASLLNTRATLRVLEVLIEVRENVRDISGSDS
jgi:hypothetical protein